MATCEVGSSRVPFFPFVVEGISSLPAAAAVAAVIYSINLCVKLLLLFRHLLLLPPLSDCCLSSVALFALCEFNVTLLCWLGKLGEPGCRT